MKRDRTYLAVNKQLTAMGAEHYEVGISHPEKGMLQREWTASEIRKNIPWLKQQNTAGANIYIRPEGSVGLLLVDDITRSTIDSMKEQGYAPAVVTQTSPANYQAWVRVSQQPIEPGIATLAAKGLAKAYDADPNSADWRHYGRLAGFTNRKPEHVEKDGRYPFVLLENHTGVLCKNGSKLVQWATQKHADQEESHAQRQTNRSNTSSGAQRSPSARKSTQNPGNAYRKQLEALEARYTPFDESRADWMISKDMITQGFSDEAIAEAMEKHSPNLIERKRSYVQDYIDRTLRNAHEELGEPIR